MNRDTVMKALDALNELTAYEWAQLFRNNVGIARRLETLSERIVQALAILRSFDDHASQS
jgi:hypothetical protein